MIDTQELEKQGEWAQAADQYYRALLKDPSDEQLWAQFAYAARFLQFPRDDAQLTQVLAACFTKKDTINPQHLAVPSLSLLSFQGSYEGYRNHPLFLPLARNCLVPDPFFELLLTTARKELLAEEMKDPELVEAIAAQCRLNEYIYWESPEETDVISGKMAAMYRPSTVDETEARRVAATIPVLKPITNAVSLAVAEQYEENPYPRWTGLTRRPQLPDTGQVLIAGCGTGQHAVNSAWRYPNRQFLAIDLSARALAYARSQAELLGIGNVTFLQADILDLGLLDRQFDVIECVGVLHHMEHPEEGLKVLTRLLRQGGLLNLGLYSELGRQDVVAARKFVKENKYKPTLESMRLCRRDIFRLPDDHPAKPVIYSIDFYNASACRDLIFHTMEHRFTLSEIAAMVKDNGLQLEEFELADNRVLQAYKKQFPEDAHATDWKNWERLEQQNPGIFSGMYQFWVRK